MEDESGWLTAPAPVEAGMVFQKSATDESLWPTLGCP